MLPFFVSFRDTFRGAILLELFKRYMLEQNLEDPQRQDRTDRKRRKTEATADLFSLSAVIYEVMRKISLLLVSEKDMFCITERLFQDLIFTILAPAV